jgi:hypothetical protein
MRSAIRRLNATASTATLSAVAQRRSLGTDKLEYVYYQEAYEAIARHRASTTYPGTIKAATPGDTRCHDGSTDDWENRPDTRHYWRPVVDDPQVRELVQVRVRFKENVFVAPSWEARLHVIVVSVPPDATVEEITKEVDATNVSATVGRMPYTLAHRGKALDNVTTLESLASSGLQLLDRGLTLDAIETATDHLWHTEAARPLDWNVADVPAVAQRKPPLVDLKPFATYPTEDDVQAREMPSKPPVDFGHIR